MALFEGSRDEAISKKGGQTAFRMGWWTLPK